MGAGHRKNQFGHHLSTSIISIRPEHRKWITPGVKQKDNPPTLTLAFVFTVLRLLTVTVNVFRTPILITPDNDNA